MYNIEIENNVPVGHAKSCTVNGKKYQSIAKACNALNIDPQTVQGYRSRFGITTEEAMNLAIKKRDERLLKMRNWAIAREEELRQKEKLRRDALFEFNGRTFKNFRTAIEDLSWENNIFLNEQSIKQAAKRNNCSLQEQLSKSLARLILQNKKRGEIIYHSDEEKREQYFRIYRRWDWATARPLYRIFEDAED